MVVSMCLAVAITSGSSLAGDCRWPGDQPLAAALGATEDEVRGRRPGDDIAGTPTVAAAVTIGARQNKPGRGWCGKVRAAPDGTPTGVDNVWRRRPDRIEPGLQHIAVGDVMFTSMKAVPDG